MTKNDASHWDELFRREFERESDRSCAILATAMLDSVLEIILMKPQPSMTDRRASSP